MSKKKKGPKWSKFLLLIVICISTVLIGSLIYSIKSSPENETVNTTSHDEPNKRLIGLYENNDYIGYDLENYTFKGTEYQYYVEFEVRPNKVGTSYYFGEKVNKLFLLKNYEKTFKQHLKIFDSEGKEFDPMADNKSSFKGKVTFKSDVYLKIGSAIIK